MKLKNRKTGKIVELEVHHIAGKCYESLADVNNDWEDYEEPDERQFYIGSEGDILHYSIDYMGEETDKARLSIGNYFATKEEAEKAVEKLKAWKRLKDKGFKFTGFTHKDRGRLDELEIYCQLGECPEDIEDMEDVCLLFGGEK